MTTLEDQINFHLDEGVSVIAVERIAEGSQDEPGAAVAVLLGDDTNDILVVLSVGADGNGVTLTASSFTDGEPAPALVAQINHEITISLT